MAEELNEPYVPDVTVAPPVIYKKDLKHRFKFWVFSKLSPNKTVEAKRVSIDARLVKKVLLFRYDALGDYINTTAIIEWLVAAIPNVIIDVVGSYRNSALLESDPRIRRVVAINPSHGFRPSWMRVRKIGQEEQYDVVIAAVFTQMTKAAILARLASTNALNVTIRHDTRSEIYGQVFHSQVPHVPMEHWAITMGRVGPFSIQTDRPIPADVARPKIHIDATAAERVSTWLTERGLRWQFRAENNRVFSKEVLPKSSIVGQPYIIVNISAYSPNRQWKAESVVPVISQLRQLRPDISILVSGAPSESRAVAHIVANVNDPHVQKWSGSIREMVAVIAGAQQLISPDTATIHVAAAAMVPCTVLFAELIKVAEWYPFGVPFRAVLSADPHTVNSIPPAVIVGAAVDLLAST